MRHLATVFTLLAVLVLSVPALAGQNGILIVAFGTSVPEAMPSFEAIDKSYRESYPGQPVVWAYTSDIIRKKLAKEGKPVLSVNEALNKCAQDGVTDLRIQPLHITAGEEYVMLQRMVVRNLTRFPDRFEHVWMAQPLLLSSRDLDEAITAILKNSAKTRKKGEALILMGHGNDRGPGDLVMARVHNAFLEKDPLVFVATVEGANSFESLLPLLKKKRVKKACLQPLMVVAGDHARNDLAGSEDDSWASQLRKAGIRVQADLQGLGELQGIREIYLRHTKDTEDDMAHPKKVD